MSDFAIAVHSAQRRGGSTLGMAIASTMIATHMRRPRAKASGSVANEIAAATSSAGEKDSPAAIVPTSTEPTPVPASKPMFQNALAVPYSLRETALSDSSRVRF